MAILGPSEVVAFICLWIFFWCVRRVELLSTGDQLVEIFIDIGRNGWNNDFEWVALGNLKLTLFYCVSVIARPGDQLRGFFVRGGKYCLTDRRGRFARTSITGSAVFLWGGGKYT